MGNNIAFGSHPETGRWDPEIAQAALKTNVSNIISKFRLATPEQMETGTAWYQKAHEHALRVGRGNAELGAGLIAALSPSVSWERNLDAAHHVVNTGTPSKWQTEKNNTKALRILAGEHPLQVLGGNKVVSFYHNIINPFGTEHITIDRHAHDIAIGKPFGIRGDELQSIGLGAVGRYKHFVHAYSLATGELGLEVPNVTQAVTWTVHRGSHL